MTYHSALLDLPEYLMEAGFNVIVADGYGTAQGNYFWTDPDTGIQSFDQVPFGYMVHHSGSPSAVPPPADTSKGNAWIGLYRDGRLYQDGGGVPTIYLACSGPARTSSGYGYRPAAWDHTFQDRRAPAHAEGPDGDTALNRYVFNVETVHRGDGSAIDPGVWECVVGLGVVLADMFGWTERTISHAGWSARKIDPKWSLGLPHDGADCIIDVQDAIAMGGGSVFTHFRVGETRDEWEPYVWLLYMLNGGTIDPNENSSQVESLLPWKAEATIRTVQVEDFEMLQPIIGWSDYKLNAAIADGLYRWGKELSSLQEQAFR